MEENPPNNLISLPGGDNLNEMKESLRQLKVILPEMLEYMKITAELHRTKYCALKEQGFSDVQALELSRDLGCL